MWPKGYFCNGYVNVNGVKMSKSEGNFYTIKEIIEEFGADATRMSLAVSGDGLDDANFTLKNANDAILSLSTLEMWIKDTIKSIGNLRTTSPNPRLQNWDDTFENEMLKSVCETRGHYDQMRYRDVVREGFYDF